MIDLRMRKPGSLARCFLVVFVALALVACGGEEAPAPVVEPPPPPPHPWDLFIDAQIEAHLAAHPAWAVTQGRHEFDGKLPDWSEDGIRREVQRLRAAKRDAEAFADADLTPEMQFQRDYFIARIDHDLFWLVKARWPFRNPQFYFGWLSDSLDPSPYVTLDYAPVEERMAAFTRYLEALPEAARQIRGNLRMPMPLPWLELGIDAFSGYASYFRDEVPAVWAEVEDPAMQQRFARANERAVTVMSDLAEWLESGRNIADESYALGPALYREMLWDTERVRISLADLLEAARSDMQRNLAELRNACAEFAPGFDLPNCMTKMSDNKPEAGSVAAARAQIVESRAFLDQTNLVSIPGNEEALVEVAPPYARSNFAYIAIPGPWEANQPSIYYIAPPDPAWSEDVQRDYIAGEADLLFTSIHEVWPGHFLQFMHANRSPWIFGRAFVSYAFAEGWAHYTEEMMLEAGFRDRDPEARVGQLSNALLRNARFIASLGLHTDGWTVEDAKNFFMDEAFQAEGTALRQAARGTYDPAYLNYTLGKLMIQRLREDWTAERGGREAWREFHDTFLSFGGPPIPLVRQQMMGEPEPRTVLPEPVTVIAPLPVIKDTAQEEEERQYIFAWDCGSRFVVSIEDPETLELELFVDQVGRKLSRVRSASGVRYEGDDIEFWNQGEEALLVVDGVETTCSLNRYQSDWIDAERRGAVFRALGNEPGWYVEVFTEGESKLVLDSGETTLRFEASGPADLEPGPGAVYTGKVQGLDIRIERTPGPCQDTMVDVEYESHVLVNVGGRLLRGCGRALD